MSNNIRRVNFFGAPSAGKSVLATELFVHCKKFARNCEVVNELAREWAYVDRNIQSMDQVYLFASQLNREDTLLSRSKVQFVISDSPLMLNIFYSNRHNPKFKEPLEQLSRIFDQKYESINFFCPINYNYAFHKEGRHFDYEESKIFSDQMKNFLDQYYKPEELHIVPQESRLQFVIDKLENVFW